MSVLPATRAFRAVLALYPRSFRDEYGGEMWRVFAARRAEAHGGAVVALWLATIADALGTAARLHADMLRQDLGYALRTTRRAPGLSATILLVAALGIGANATAFCLADYVLWRPLPFADAGRLVAVWQRQVSTGGHWELSPSNYREWKKRAPAFSQLGASASISANLVGVGEPQRLEGASLTADVLPLLGVAPARGRGFTADDDRDGAPGTVLLSWGLWQDAFAGDDGVLGRTITLDGEPYAVIGVMPPSFAYPTREAQLWRPMRFAPDAFDDASNTYLRVVGRLAPGATLADARAQLDVAAAGEERAHPKENDGVRAAVIPLREELSERSRVLVLALSGAAVCVLLIACLNIANLLFARALVRRRELALRAALGAGRERLVRQLVTESVAFAVAGGLFGLGLAALALPLLSALVPAELPVNATPAIDLRVIAATGAATLAAIGVFGVVPSLRAAGGVDGEALREGARSGVSGRRGRLVRAIVVVEVAASLTLLVSSGLLLRALERVAHRDPGFRSDGVLTLRTTLPWPKYAKTADRARYYERVLADARALPGVDGAAYVSFLPMAFGGGIWPVTIPGHADETYGQRTVSLRFATPQLFATLGVPLRAGRDFDDGDRGDRPFVAVVSESFARRHFPGQDAVGKTFEVAFAKRTIVGVVGDVRVRGLERASEPQVYLPYRQVPDGWLTFFAPKDLVVHSSQPLQALAPSLRAIVRAADAEQPVSNVRTLADVVAAQTVSRRAQLRVIGAFAALAFVLAAIGLYGLLSFAVSTRAREIGVRMALGATPRAVVAMVLGEGALLGAIGIAVGSAAAWAAGRSLQAALAGVAPTDGPTLAVALALIAIMALAGSALPAWRAARVDPSEVLRAE